MKSFVRILGSVVGLTLVLLVTSTVVFAQHAAKGDNGANGQQVAVDKQTGKLRQPTAEEAKQLIDGLTPLLNDSPEGLTAVHRNDGSVFVDLQGRFMSVAVAKIGADGKVEEKCVTSVAEVKEFLSGEAKDANSKNSKAKAEVKQAAPALEEK